MDFDIERTPVNVDPGIKELSIKLTAAEKKIASLQEEYDEMLEKQINMDYRAENQKKVIENLQKTLVRYETENRAFRELIRLWI